MMLFANLVSRSRSDPDATFCHFFAGDQYTRHSVGGIVADAAVISAGLTEHGVRSGQIVPIVLEHRAELYSSFIGCVLAGAVPAFLPPLTRKQDTQTFRTSMSDLLRRLEPRCVVGSTKTLPTLDLSGMSEIDVDLVGDTKKPSIAPISEANMDAVAMLQHSSGTTGLKKAVALTHRTILTQVAHYGAAIGLTGSDVVASWLPLYHDMGLITSFLLPAVAGVPIVSIDALEWVSRPTMLLDQIERFRASLCWLPNFAFHHIARLAEPDRNWDLASMRMIVNCSEPCRSSSFDGFIERFQKSGVRPDMLRASYAMAENVFAVTQTRPTPRLRPTPAPAAGYVSSGRPIAGARIRIMRDDGVEAVSGEPGGIEIATDCLFEGYFRQPDLTVSRLRDGWYRTGDIGLLDDEDLFVVGRSDDLLNINGKKLVAHEIEDALNAVVGVVPGRVLVYSAHDDGLGATQLVVAAERSTPDGVDDIATQAEIRRSIMAECGLRPSRIVLLERGVLLKSTSGKLARQASIERLASLREFVAR